MSRLFHVGINLSEWRRVVIEWDVTHHAQQFTLEKRQNGVFEE